MITIVFFFWRWKNKVYLRTLFLFLLFFIFKYTFLKYSFLFFLNEKKRKRNFPAKLKSVYEFGLYVCAFARSLSRFRKYSWSNLKFMYNIHVYYSMIHIENGVDRMDVSCTGARKNYLNILRTVGGNNLKCHLASLSCDKCIKINMS